MNRVSQKMLTECLSTLRERGPLSYSEMAGLLNCSSNYARIALHELADQGFARRLAAEERAGDERHGLTIAWIASDRPDRGTSDADADADADVEAKLRQRIASDEEAVFEAMMAAGQPGAVKAISTAARVSCVRTRSALKAMEQRGEVRCISPDDIAYPVHLGNSEEPVWDVVWCGAASTRQRAPAPAYRTAVQIRFDRQDTAVHEVLIDARLPMTKPEIAALCLLSENLVGRALGRLRSRGEVIRVEPVDTEYPREEGCDEDVWTVTRCQPSSKTAAAHEAWRGVR